VPPYRCVDGDDCGGVVVGWVLIETLMWTMPVEMALILTKDRTSVSPVVDQQSVGALGPDAAHEPLGIRVRPRRGWRDLDHVDAFGGEHGVEGTGELGVAVADQKVRGSSPFGRARSYGV
jgi:hypothetical protein